jgi:sugar lactone lactonase YvrE
LWFTEVIGNKIGRITTAGVVTNEYVVPTANSGPYGIAVGPDGALWFTEKLGVGKIGWITTAGIFTDPEFSKGLTANSAPSGITAGPDGAVWFTEVLGNNIGRICTTATLPVCPVGTISEYGVPTLSSNPNSIAAGPDGALWFVENLGNKIGQVVLNPSPAAENQAQQAAPIKLGTSGSNVKDKSAGYCCGGTLGSLVRDGSGNTYILSNNHVLARSNAGKIHEPIIQRAYIDTVPTCSTTGTINVAQLSQFVPLAFGGTAKNTVDAAIAQTDPGMVDPVGGILGIGTISAATVTPKLNMPVEKAGRTTGLTFGSIDTLDFTIVIQGYGPCGVKSPKVAKFVGQFRVLPFNTFNQGGDSGSLIVQQAAVGMALVRTPLDWRLRLTPRAEQWPTIPTPC